jgi:hypothetical protein
MAYAVASHVFSQRMEEGTDAHVCGLRLGSLPRATRFQHIQTEAQPQRVSSVPYYKALAPLPPPIVHAPARHRAVLKRLYAALDVAPRWRPGGAPATSSDLAVHYDRARRLGHIRVYQVGYDTGAEVRRAQGDLRATTGAEVIYLELPLAQAGTPALCEAAEAAGFFFGWLAPLGAQTATCCACNSSIARWTRATWRWRARSPRTCWPTSRPNAHESRRQGLTRVAPAGTVPTNLVYESRDNGHSAFEWYAVLAFVQRAQLARCHCFCL